MTGTEYIRQYYGGNPEIGIVLGSGLGALADMVEDRVEIRYSDIPGFPQSTVKGHGGRLILGRIGNREVAMMDGRFHYYEGYTMKEITYPVKVMNELGVKLLVLTNACGAINEEFEPGDIVLIEDYLNFSFNNPLIGPNDDEEGPRFPDMSEPYDRQIMDRIKEIAGGLGMELKEGVYTFFCGPCFETRAEIRAFKTLGADLVGMSTVPETIRAGHLGMKVVAFGTVTNMATGIQKMKHSHERVLEVAGKASENLIKIIEGMIKEIEL